MTNNFDIIKAELRKATARELTDSIKTINATLTTGRLVLSGRKEDVVTRIATFLSNLIVTERLTTATAVVRILNQAASKKMSLTLEDNVIIGSGRPKSIQRTVSVEEIAFKPNPFYKPLTRLGTIKICPISSNIRQSKTFQFTLSGENRRLITMPNISDDRPPYQIRFYCSRYHGQYTDLTLEFPSVCELKVNDTVIQGNNLRCIKGRPGTVNPPDISIMTRKQAVNNVELVYINNDSTFIAGIYIVERTSVPQLIQTIKETRVLSKEAVLEKLQQTQEDADIIMESETLQTKDPLAFTRIVTPIRAKTCPHLQCFDANVFLTMNEQTPTWTCPVCNRRIESWEDLIVDEYFAEMLENTPKHIDSVRVEPNGHITIIDENPDLVEDDDDEEEEEYIEPIKKEEHTTILLDDDEDEEEPVNNQTSIPPSSTSEQGNLLKRKQSDTLVESIQKKQKTNVIDLTLDSDDEEDTPLPTARTTNETLILPHLQTLYNEDNENHPFNDYLRFMNK